MALACEAPTTKQQPIVSRGKKSPELTGVRVERLAEAGGASVWDYWGAAGCQPPSSVTGYNVAAFFLARNLVPALRDWPVL